MNTGDGLAPPATVAVAVVGFRAGINPRISTGYTAMSALLIACVARLTGLFMICGP